jgi:hypothetical protein
MGTRDEAAGRVLIPLRTADIDREPSLAHKRTFPTSATGRSRSLAPRPKADLRTDAFAANPIVRQIQAAGATTARAIAAARNDRGVRTARGGEWHDSTVRNLLARAN